MVVGSVGSDKYLTFSFCRSIYRSLSDHLRPRNNVQVGRRDGVDLIEKLLEGITLQGMRKHDDIALIEFLFFFFSSFWFQTIVFLFQNNRVLFNC